MSQVSKTGSIYKGTLTHPATKYVEVPFAEATQGALHLRWFDGTSSATVTLETTNYDVLHADAGPTSTTAGVWIDEGLTITGPSAAAAGGSMLNMNTLGARRARVKIVTAADTVIEVLWHGKY